AGPSTGRAALPRGEAIVEVVVPAHGAQRVVALAPVPVAATRIAAQVDVVVVPPAREILVVPLVVVSLTTQQPQCAEPHEGDTGESGVDRLVAGDRLRVVADVLRIAVR